MMLLQWWDDFFHSRTKVDLVVDTTENRGSSTANKSDTSSSSSSSSSSSITSSSGCSRSTFVLCGRIRIAYALLLLMDRFVLYYDFDYFFTSGILPCKQHLRYGYYSDEEYALLPKSFMCSIAGSYGSHDLSYSSYIYYSFYYLGIINSILLLLGIYPKLQLIFLHINLLSFHFHNSLIWDGEDNMFKIWNFLLLFIPLNTLTIYDRFHGIFYDTYIARCSSTIDTMTATNDNDTATNTWPMWPFRLWQIEIFFIYFGCGYTKLATPIWNSGNALYSVIHTKDFFGGPITPDFLFGYRGPLQIMTYASLFVECACIIFIWPKCTRIITLIAIVALHIGIDGAMNMHCFEWLSILGWLFFLVERQPNNPTDTKNTTKNTLITGRFGIKLYNILLRTITNVFILIVVVTMALDAFPAEHLTRFIPYDDTALESSLLQFERFRQNVLTPQYFEPYLYPLGLYQNVWDLFTGNNDHNYRIETVITYNNNTSISHWSPDWGEMTWYEKKRWQRVMTYYENFKESACKDCYASYYAKMYGSNNDVASVRLLSHCEYPILEPPGNVFDASFFFKPAKEELVKTEPEELYSLNYCDDIDDRCDLFAKIGYCTIDDDEKLFFMVKKCRYICNMCQYDVDKLNVTSRISVFFSSDERYFDGTVIEINQYPHIRLYLIKFDGFVEPERLSAKSLRSKGFILLPPEFAEIEDPSNSENTKSEGNTERIVFDEVESAEKIIDDKENYIDNEETDLGEEGDAEQIANNSEDSDQDDEEEEGGIEHDVDDEEESFLDESHSEDSDEGETDNENDDEESDVADENTVQNDDSEPKHDEL